MSIRNLVAAGLLAATMPTAAVAQPAPASTTQVDPARLAAARELMSLIMPPAQREAMTNAMIGGVMANMTAGISNSANLEAAFAAQPAARAVWDRFIARQMQLATDDLQAEMPALIEVMAKAYARRFTLDQMADISAFFGTPTGQAYLRESMTVMSDPDVAAWQRRVMAESMGRVPAEMERFMNELKAAGVDPAAPVTGG